MRILKRNTAINLTVGPFISATNGITPTIPSTVSAFKISFIMDDMVGGSTAIAISRMHESIATESLMTVIGTTPLFTLKMASSLVGTLPGPAFLSISPTATNTFLPVFHEFMIQDDTSWDGFMGSTGAMRADLRTMAAGVIGSTNFEGGALSSTVFAAGCFQSTHFAAGFISATKIAGTTFTSAKFASGAITGTNTSGLEAVALSGTVTSVTDGVTLADGAISNTKIAAGAFASTNFATSAALKWADYVWDYDMSLYTGAGTAVAGGAQLAGTATGAGNSDPWEAALPGTYAATTAGGLVASMRTTVMSIRESQITLGATVNTILATSNAIYGTIPTILNTANAIYGTIPTILATSNAILATTATRATQTSVDTIQNSISAGVTVTTNNDHSGFKKNTSVVLPFPMVQPDHFTAATVAAGAITVYRSLDGGAFGTMENSPSALTAGWYKITLTASEMNATTVALYAVAGTEADQRNIFLKTSD